MAAGDCGPTNVSDSQQAAEATPQVQPPEAELISFIRFLKSKKSFEAERQLVRVTSKGLFVDLRAKEAVLNHYQEWFKTETKGEIEKSLEKLESKLFGGKTPDRMYLVEGKTFLIGNVAPATIPVPQQSGLPFFLGGLIEAKNQIHPLDPTLQGSTLLEIKQSPTGTNYIVKLHSGTCVISNKMLNEFVEIIKGSPFLSRRFPKSLENRAEALKALMLVVNRAKVPRKEAVYLLPFKAKINNKASLRMWRKMMILISNNELWEIAEFSGRNLEEFLHKELRSTAKEKLGSFRVTAIFDRRELGRFQFKKHMVSVSPRAFAEFMELIQRAKEPRERFSAPFTVGDCFERFSSYFQLAQDMDRSKIQSLLDHRHVTASRCKMYGGWVFALSRREALIRVVARHIFIAKRGRHGPSSDKDD